ncbi:MAG: radical SAM protein [Anaerofustis stercorihominis]|nr:radical SAM protein [Anaerofustis stercorihominis]
MKISKKDALMWFEYFAEYCPEEELMPLHQEIVLATLRQIEESVENKISSMMSEIKELKTLDKRTYFVGNEEKFSDGCRSCLAGQGLNAIRKTNKCNIECKFCYNYGELHLQPPVGEGMWEIGGSKCREDDIEMLLSVCNRPSGVSYVYLEPFMEIEKYYGIIRKFADAGIHQHMYTNGTLATEENIKALADAGLNELRFNLGATNCSDKVIKNIAIAKKYIPSVGIETPMTPEFFDSFMKKKDAVLATGVDFINCAELHLNCNNLENYLGENMYMSRHGYLSPVWSRQITMQLMKLAVDEGWDIAVHDCSNRTKFIRGLNQRAKEGANFGANNYGSEFDIVPYIAFLPILRDDSFEFLSEEPLPKEYMPGYMIY